MKEEYTLTIEQVAVRLGCAYKTICNWYAFKRKNPTNEWSLKLPDYKQVGPRQARYWRECDIPKLIEFRDTIPRGRNGVLGSVTQGSKYKKNKE